MLNTNPTIPVEDKLAKEVVDAAFHVHQALGPGLLESVYELALAYELAERGITVERQVPVAIQYRGIKFKEGFRADLVVDDLVIVELKSVKEVTKLHRKQLLTYLRLADKRLGILINFGSLLFKEGVFRVANRLPEASRSEA